MSLQTAIEANNLGVAYHRENKFQESDALHKQCVAILETLSDSDNRLRIAHSLGNRAALYRTFHEYHEAERLFQIALREFGKPGDVHRIPTQDQMLPADIMEENGQLRLFGEEVRALRNAAPGEIRRVVEKLGPWYHHIELAPGITTETANKGFPASRWKIMEPFVPRDLSGLSVLDIGCNSGFYSFEMKKRNAKRVVGIDIMPHVLAQARFLSHWFDQPVELRELEAYDIESLGQFDVVVFVGVLYHLKHPLYALEKVAAVCKDLMLIQSLLRGDERDFTPAENYPQSNWAIFERPEFPKMYFIEKSYNGDESNWWAMNRSCLKGMIRTAGFQRIRDTSHPEVLACNRG